MDWPYLLNSFHGRIGRQTFWIAMLVVIVANFLACYVAFAREIVDHGHHNRWQTLLPELIAREIGHLGHDAKIRLFRCEQGRKRQTYFGTDFAHLGECGLDRHALFPERPRR